MIPKQMQINRNTYQLQIHTPTVIMPISITFPRTIDEPIRIIVALNHFHLDLAHRYEYLIDTYIYTYDDIDNIIDSIKYIRPYKIY